MTSSWLPRRWLWVLTAGVLVASTSGAVVWIARDRATPLEKDCATVQDLGRQTNELGAWMNTGSDAGTVDKVHEIVERQSALSHKMRAAAGSVTTPGMKKPLNTWADAMALNAQLQREANRAAPGEDPPAQWMIDAHRSNLLTDEALDALNQECPGLKQVVRGS